MESVLQKFPASVNGGVSSVPGFWYPRAKWLTSSWGSGRNSAPSGYTSGSAVLAPLCTAGDVWPAYLVWNTPFVNGKPMSPGNSRVVDHLLTTVLSSLVVLLP
jgi:hypothetical protein